LVLFNLDGPLFLFNVLAFMWSLLDCLSILLAKIFGLNIWKIIYTNNGFLEN